MRRGSTMVLASVVACGLFASAAYAGPPGCCSKKAAKTAKVAKTDGAEACAKACLAGEFPTMRMIVGDKSYDCPKTAARVAKESGAKVIFAVGEEKFDGQAKAMPALADAAEGFVTRFTTIACVVDGKLVLCDDKAKSDCAKACAEKAKTAAAKSACAKACAEKAKTAAGGHCGGMTAKVAKSQDDASQTKATAGGHCGGMTAKAIKPQDDARQVKAAGAKAPCDGSKCEKFIVLGREFKTHEEAVKARAKALKAIERVHMTFVVNGEEVKLASEVCPKAKAAGQVKFVVNDTTTSCEYSARVSLARAKYEAAKNLADKLARL